jgi:arylformamidase
MWKYLSYPLDGEAFGYGNGDRFKMEFVRSMCCGDTSNNSVFSMPTHYGTHLDYPFHFSDDGKKSDSYSAQDFVFDKVGLLDISSIQLEGYLIKNEHLDISDLDKEINILVVKTGFCYKRSSDEYWERAYGFHKETAAYLKSNFPTLKAIAFDLISLNSYQERPHGREAHKAFLVENDILIIEEVDLREVNANSTIEQLIVAPLQLDKADGAPCTILAKLNEH